MKLPDVGRGQVESLGRVDVQGEAMQAAGPYQVAQKGLQTAAKITDDFVLLKEQENTLKAYTEATQERRDFNAAIDQVSGKVNVDLLPDDLRTSYMTSSDAQNAGQFDQDIYNADGQRLVELHRVQPAVDKYFQDREAGRQGNFNTRRERELYRGRDKGEADKFRYELDLAAKKSVIDSTINMSLENMQYAAEDGDVSGVNELADFLKDAEYLKPAKVEALRAEKLEQIKLVRANEADSIQRLAGVSAFEGESSEVALSTKEYRAKISGMVSDKLITQEQADQANYLYDLDVNTQELMGQVKSLYDGKGRQAAIDLIDKQLREEGSPFTQDDKRKQSVKLNQYFNLLDRNHRTSMAAWGKKLKADVKDYVIRISIGHTVDPTTRNDLYESVGELENGAELRKQMDDADRLADFSSMPRADREAQLTKLNNEDATFLGDSSVIKSELAANQRVNEAYRKDGLGQAVKQRIIPPDAIDWDWNDLEGSMLKNETYAEQVSEHSGMPTGIFPVGIAKGIANGFKKGELPKPQLQQILGNMAYLKESSQKATAKQLFDQGAPELAMAMHMASDGQPLQNIIDGMAYMRLDKDIVPNQKSEADKTTFEEQLENEGVFEAFTRDPEMRAAALAAIKAEYAGLTGNVKSKFYDPSLIDQAIANVTGGIMTYGDSKTLRTQAPYRGAKANVINEGLNQFDQDSLERMGGAYGFSADQIVEKINDGNAYLQSLGNGRYAIYAMNAYTQQYAPIKDGQNYKPFVLDWQQIRDPYAPLDDPDESFLSWMLD